MRSVAINLSAAALLGMAAPAASAQQLSGMEVDNKTAHVGDTVTVRVGISPYFYCGATVSFGDGSKKDGLRFKGQTESTSHVYARAGTYSIQVVGDVVPAGLMTAPPCGGSLPPATIVVTDPAAQGQATPSTMPHTAVPPAPSDSAPSAPPPRTQQPSKTPGASARPAVQPRKPARDWAPR